MRLSLSIAGVLLTLALATPAGAQTNTAVISCVVRDHLGAVLTGATVTATHPASGTVIERVTGADGRFLLPELRVGQWEIRANSAGFSPQTVQVSLEVGRTQNVNFALPVEGVTTDVVVTAAAPLLQTTTAEISDVISNQEVVQIPLSGRNFLALAQLSDAVVIPPGGTRGEALQQAGPLPNVSGQRSGHNIYLLDGTKVTDELFNNLVINPSVDSIEEFKIQKSMYPAEFGGKASALINVITRAGANSFRGSGFEFFRDDAFDAPNYFQPQGQGPPPLRQNQFGGSLGGPVLESRTFFFASYEGLRLSRSATRTFSVAPMAAREGRFDGIASICDPLTIPSTGVCQPFVDNRIPTERIDPIAAAFMQNVPRPTSGDLVQNLVASEQQPRDIDQVSLRLDHRVGSGDQVFGRFSTFDADETQPFGASGLQEALVPGFGRSLTTRTRNLALSYTRVLTPSVLNEVRFGWMNVSGGQTSLNRGTDFAGSVGLEGVTTDPRDVGFPQISTAGQYAAMGDPTSFTSRRNTHFELYNNVTVDRGRHRLKFGGYFYHLRLRPEQPDVARGSFTYTGQFSGNAFADFLLGYPTSSASGIGRGDEDGRTNWLHLYAQDDWHVRSNLTLNLGLRYEFNQHMYADDDRLSSVDLSVPGGQFVIASDDDGNIHPSANELLPLIPTPWVTSESLGWNRGLLSASPVRLAPRLGFALSLDDARAVIRGGYGIFLNQWAYSVQTAFARNLPFFFTKQVDVPTDLRVPPYRTADVLTTNATGTVGASIMDHDYAVEYSQTWSGGVQYELTPGTIVDIGYMTWTLGADNATIRNVPEPGPGSIQARRPIPELSRINAIRFDGKSIYHGFTVKTERRLRSGASFNVSYTLSTSKDDASSPGATEAEANVPQDVRNIFSDDGEWAPSSFDHRQQFIASGTYAFPFFATSNGIGAAILGGWQASAVFIAQSGSPFTVNLATDRANVGAGPAQRPNALGDPDLPGGQRTPERWFNTDAFALPDLFTFGTARRNSVVGPGYANVDLALAKHWRPTNAPHVELRCEVFNLFNRANFDLPNRTFGNSNFGRIFSAKAPREMQFGVRMTF